MAFRERFGPPLIALVAVVATLATIAPDGGGPGVTCDEPYHVYQGKQLVTALRQQGFAFFLPANIDQNFAWEPGGPPVQAPLGYWILGWTHYLFDPAPDDPSVLSITAARFAPAMAFALLILIVGVWTGRREGHLAGTVAAAAVALTPRLFGHAHLAALDMLTTLFFVAAVLAVTEAVRGGRFWQVALAGVVWGAAMLVRLHGLLVAPPVILWMIWRLRRRAFLPLMSWLTAGGLTFLAGWPWLWLAPLARFHQYLVSGTGRQMLHVFYAGQVWNDRDVPWHYPWVMFAVTVPLGLLLLGLVGLWSRWFADPQKANVTRLATAGTAACGGTRADVPSAAKRRCCISFPRGNSRRTRLPWVADAITAKPARPHPDPLPEGEGTLSNLCPEGEGSLSNPFPEGEGVLLAGTMAFVLLVFSWPGTPVYDGVRLFLMVFPLWAIWAGIGAQRLAAYNIRSRSAVAVLLLVALQGTGLIVYYPCHLSYYNLLVGGLPGAERLGFEVTYWGDTVREPMLAEAARLSHGEPVLFAPDLAPFQAPAVSITSPALREAGVALVGPDPSNPQAAKGCRYAVVYHRRADLADAEWVLKHGRAVGEYRNQGVWLARLIELDAPLDVPAQHIRIDGLP